MPVVLIFQAADGNRRGTWSTKIPPNLAKQALAVLLLPLRPAPYIPISHSKMNGPILKSMLHGANYKVNGD